MHLQFTRANGEVLELQTDARPIKVRSWLENEPQATLRDDMPLPRSVYQEDFTVLWVAGALIAMLLGAIAYRLISKWYRRRPKPVAPPPPAAPPWELALRTLQSLKQQRRSQLENGSIDLWVDEVSDAFRKYLGDRFGFDGLERTTDEIVDCLKQKHATSELANETKRFLSECDLVKFANAPIADEASSNLIDEAIHVVERTRGSAVELQR
ncbi:MAG: hypothetical protein R3A47_11275 [Polyangiales bacterium]